MPNGSLSIGEVAARAGVAVDTVRYYERRGVLPPAPRKSSGYRAFQPQAVERIAFVKELQGLGFTLDELVALLELVDTNEATCGSAREYAVATLERMDEKIRALSAMRAQLASMVEACGDGGCEQIEQATPRIRLPVAAPARSRATRRAGV